MTQYEKYTNDKLRKNIEYYELKEGVTHKDLQDEIGMGKVYLSRLLSNGSIQQPGIHVIRNLSLLMGVSMETLVYGDVEKFEDQLEEKQRKFINKLIEDTKSNKIMWQKFKMIVDYDESTMYDLYHQPDLEEQVYIFESKFGRNYINSVTNTSSAFKVSLDIGVEVILVELVYDKEEDLAYELYIANNESCIKCCTNESVDDEVFIKLRSLWGSIVVDEFQKVLDEIYTEYLNLDKDEE